MRTALTILLLGVLVTGCAHRGGIQGAVIRLPEEPKRIAVSQEGQAKQAGATYIEPPVRISPNTEVEVRGEGGALLTPRSWRAVKYSLTEWPRWGAVVRQIVKAHNEALKAGDRPWWAIWKTEF